jgi:hypothetical protein
MALNDIDAAVESFQNALDLEPSDGLSLYSSLRILLLAIDVYLMSLLA